MSKRKLETKTSNDRDGEPAAKRARPESKAEAKRVDAVDCPTDTFAALTLLRDSFPFSSLSGERPLCLLHSLYALVNDRTLVDRELDQYKRANTLRLVKLVSLKGEYAIVFTKDLEACISSSIAQLDDTAVAQDRKLILERFMTKLLPSNFDVSVSHESLLASVAGGLAALKPEEAISFLVLKGLLVSRAPDAWWFAVPGSGKLVRDITQGRREIAQIISRRKFKEIPLQELLQKKLRTSSRDMRFHVRDMIGGGMLRLNRTTLGDIVRLDKAR